MIINLMRKGLSEYLGTAMLILIAVVASVLVGTWSIEMSKNQGESITNQTQESLACKYASIYISNATFNCSSNCNSGINHTLNITIKNNGQTQLTFNKLYAINSSGYLFEFPISVNVTVNTGNIVSLFAISNASCTPLNNSISKVKAVSINCPGSGYDEIETITYLNC